jgi:hypothetical protein
MSRFIPNKLYYLLPYAFRRTVFRVYKPHEFHRLQFIRQEKLSPFIQNECIFIHIPKTGGISVTNGLFGQDTGWHLSAKAYIKIFTKNEFNSFFKFTFVRNPWSRLVSAYHFLKSGGLMPFDKKWAFDNLSQFDTFECFVTNWINRKNVNSYIHFIPQYKFISLNSDLRIIVDYIGRFETLNHDFEIIKSKLRLHNANLPHLNKAVPYSSKNYKYYYNEKTRKIVSDVYSKDIELFKYKFN